MAAGRYRFGLFAFDADRLELRREGALLRLQAQPAQVLACLVERAGQVVSREDLRKAVWGEATFVDFEAGLNFCISQIRSTLHDDSAQPVYVRTVPKSGYQFIAPVELMDSVERAVREADGAERTARREGRAVDSTQPARAQGSPPAAESFGHAAGSAREGDRFENGRSAGRGASWRWVVLGLAVVALIAVARWSWRARHVLGGQPAPILAVARFDNETGDALMGLFADGLTDNVVGQLTVRSNGNYQVIGNAQILRVPREQRDLRAIATALGAGYVVLGQVQANGEQLRILAHLIRLSDQTHIWVVRLDGTRSDQLHLETEGAERIATEFAVRMAQRPEKAGSFGAGSH